MLDVAFITFAALGCCALVAIRMAKSRGMLSTRKVSRAVIASGPASK